MKSHRAVVAAIAAIGWSTAFADTHSLRTQFSTTWDDECDVSYPGGSVVARPNSGRPNGSGGNFDETRTISGPGTIQVVVRNTGGKSVEVVGNWSIQAVCTVSIDGRQLGSLPVTGYYPRQATWSHTWTIPTSAPPPPPPPPPSNQIPAVITITAQQQIAAVQSSAGVGDLVTSGDPLTPVAPFTIRTDLIGNNGAAFSGQALQNAVSAKLQLIAQAYVLAFGRIPSLGAQGELAYWAAQPNLTLNGLLGSHSSWLRTNQSERIATIQRAFASALKRLGMTNRAPGSAELNAWNAKEMQSGTLYADVSGYPGLVSQIAASLVPPLKGRVGN